MDDTDFFTRFARVNGLQTPSPLGTPPNSGGEYECMLLQISSNSSRKTSSVCVCVLFYCEGAWMFGEEADVEVAVGVDFVGILCEIGYV